MLTSVAAFRGIRRAPSAALGGRSNRLYNVNFDNVTKNAFAERRKAIALRQTSLLK
jgi:hypothetical protein